MATLTQRDVETLLGNYNGPDPTHTVDDCESCGGPQLFDDVGRSKRPPSLENPAAFLGFMLAGGPLIFPAVWPILVAGLLSNNPAAIKVVEGLKRAAKRGNWIANILLGSVQFAWRQKKKGKR